MTWALCKHADVVAAARDPETYSSRVSRHLNVPNGIDGEEHRRYRDLIDRYFTPERVARLEPCFRELAAELVESLPAGQSLNAVSEIGSRFSVRAQCAWLGWPADLEDTLLEWMDDNRDATRSGDRDRTAAVAEQFDRIIRSLIEVRRNHEAEPIVDVTSELLSARFDGRALSDAEVVSILRNWTAGDLGSIAACIGVIVHYLAVNPGLQCRWRHAQPTRAELEAGIDEILRIDDPFICNRRVTTREVEIEGRPIPAGERVLLNWAAANRDPEVVGDPDAFCPVENAPHNLVYGIGPHHCPGRGLATLQLRILVEELLAATRSVEPAPDQTPVRELPPYGGYRSVPIVIASEADPRPSSMTAGAFHAREK